MLSLQYLNKRLKKNHIEQILTNYNIKYTTMRKDIENKINIMIKTFTEDISAFLNNMEEIAEQKQQKKNIENNQNELESLREQLKEKVHEQTQLKREMELLRIENNRLKATPNNISKNNSKKKFIVSPSSPSNKDNKYQGLNTISNFQSPMKRSKGSSSLLLKTEKKDKKEKIKDSRIFKSPQNIQMKKTKKINEFNSSDISNNKTKTLRKKEINKTHKNILSFSSSDIMSEPNKKNTNLNSSKRLPNKDKKINTTNKKDNTKNNKNGTSDKKIENKSKNIVNKSLNLISKNKEESKILKQSENNVNNQIKESEDYSSEKENITYNDENNESKSKITTEDNEEELSIIDEEISEMNCMEEEILSLMDQIKEFKQNNGLT